MQQMRRHPVTSRWLCLADECEEEASHGWQRACAEGTTAVLACPEHSLNDDSATHTHLEACTAPPECSCGGECAESCPCTQPQSPGDEV